MELKMNEYQLPEKILFNYEELKRELTEKVSHYETLVYTDDQIKEAKADKAALNKLKKALNDERIRREREYMAPFADFKNKINEIIGIIDKPIAVIDTQVRAYEDQQKEDKLKKIKELWGTLAVPEGLSFEKIYNPKWLNASTSMKSIAEQMNAAIEKFHQDMTTLANLPEFGFEAQQVYISSLDINRALAEGQRMAQVQKQKEAYEAEQKRRKAEEEARKVAETMEIPKQSEGTGVPPVEAESAVETVKEAVEQAIQEKKQWVAFQALLSTDDAIALKAFFDSRNIEFKPI